MTPTSPSLRAATILLVSSLSLCSWTACKRDRAAQKTAAAEPTRHLAVQATVTAQSSVLAMSETPGAKHDITVVAMEHGSVRLDWQDKHIYIDPVSSAMAHQTNPAADLVLVTHIHPDHLDPEAIAQVRASEDVPVISPQSVIDKAGDAIPNPTPIANDASLYALDNDLKVTAFPMYNLKRTRPDTGEPFHPKGRGNGYVLALDSRVIYISGDTECTPELAALSGLDAALLCMNLPYTMPVEEAGACARKFKPKVLIPYHHRDQDASRLTQMLEDTDIDLRLLQWYPSKDAKAHEAH